jgi:hypothetical protein
MSRDNPQHDSTGYLYLALGFSALGLVFGLSVVTRMIGAASIPIWGASLVALIFVANGPLGKAIARRIGGEVAEGQPHQELADAVYAELDELRARMAEMEERQDFSERLLANREHAQADPEGGERP